MDLNLKSVHAADLRSRAIDIDDEDEENAEEFNVEIRKKFEVTLNVDARQKCDVLLISAGSVFSNYLECCVYNLPTCKLVGNVVEVGESSTKINKICHLSDTSNAKIYAINAEKVNDEDSYHWTEKVIEAVCDASSKIFVLLNDNLRSYKCWQSAGDSSELFVKYLSSSFIKNDDTVRSFSCLEQPNIISGLSAQILTYAELNGLHCVVFVMFHSIDFPSSFLTKFFKKSNIINVCQVDSEKLKQFEMKLHSQSAASGLYM
ncbi:hypothetical protein HELRODRAFT_177130 [Helobdella robusta]|uniref:Proteasome assembly chaperone 1 n=1 Tax=Helobdella robusta TaxID=6412 RepID=T1FB93_HELRO|nr:hypothetical protein HELRODRAFT_177130 [Helobdella robusta]ESN98249.1 hypothetical protein HELRODRAFT_177130 [Helobdella robusta]